MEGAGLTHLVKELVLSKVPDVLQLLHGEKPEGTQEALLVVTERSLELPVQLALASCPWQPPMGPPSSSLFDPP